jgi:ABC-2 type transport system permease protein
MLAQFQAIFKREFLGYFRSPVAYVFIVIFLVTAAGSSFFLGGLYQSNQSSLDSLFSYLPWIYLVFIPAVGMRLWAEERRSGTLELLLTLPVSVTEAVLAKFFAAWIFLATALILTFPLILTVNYLGNPDHGIIFSGYMGGFLMAGSYLAISCFTSALTKNQVISFILGVLICFIMVLLGWGVFSDILSGFLPVYIIDFINELGFISHFQSLSRGLIDTRDIIYFLSIITIGLSLNGIVINIHRQ